MIVPSSCKAETLIGTLTINTSPSHRYKYVLLEFFKTYYVSDGTELIYFWNQIYFKLWRISQMANHTVLIEGRVGPWQITQK